MGDALFAARVTAPKSASEGTPEDPGRRRRATRVFGRPLRRRLGKWGIIGAGLLCAAAAAAAPATRPADVVDAYAAAVQRVQAAAEQRVRARQQAVAEFRATPAFAAADHDVAVAFDAYAERRNAIMVSLEGHDPRFATFKRQAADIDAEIARAGQTPATTVEQFDGLLVQRADFGKQLQASEDDAVNRDADAKRLRQAWADACGRLAEVQAKQSAAVAAAAAVRSAEAAMADARLACDKARGAVPATAEGVDRTAGEPTAADLARRYPRQALGWSDVVGTGGGDGRS